ncbi:MAG: hypothetical protein GXY33_06165 [Phycisphaerae bacterium]|nr:hypothetical protein [Phycisphaerae bacterium]
MSESYQRIGGAIDSAPIFDVHSHLGTGGQAQARTLADIVSYHWLATDLACAAGRRFERDPRKEPEEYLREVLPYFPAVRNTVNHFALMHILRDLHGLEDRTLTERNWERVDRSVREHADDPQWVPSVLDRANIRKVCTNDHDIARDEAGRYVPYVQAEYLYVPSVAHHLKHIGGPEQALPETAEGLAAAIEARVARLVEKKVRVLHVWAPGTWIYRATEPQQIDPLLKRLLAGEKPSKEERDLFASFCADATAGAAGRHQLVVQLFHGTLHYAERGPASYWNPEFLRSLTEHFARHRETHFDLFLSTRIPSHEAVSFSRIFPNLHVSGAWWQGFSPSTLTVFFRDRLEMLPNTAWNAYYSDGYIVEWIYGKLPVTKNRLAHALAAMVDEELLTLDDALEMGPQLLYDNAMQIYKP